MSDPAPTLTVGIATKNRPDALVRCLRSLRLLDGMLAEAIVVDDGSDPPAEGGALAALADLPPEVRFIRHDASVNVSASRNEISREARTPWVLNLDDDAFIVSADAVRAAVAVLEADPEVAAVAFAQGDEAGRAFPPAAQGHGDVDGPVYVPAFVGFAHVVRRDAFLAVGGFQARLGINGEEKELCLRLLDAGYRVVYLPDAVIGHVADSGNRDQRRYLHQTVRNTTLSAIYDEPFPLVIGGAALRLWRYFPMRKGWRIDDPGGFGRVVAGLARELPAALRERRPVRWATWTRWRRMTQAPPEPYLPAKNPT